MLLLITVHLKKSFCLGDLPNPGIESGSPALQVDSLPSEPPGKPRRDAIDMEIQKNKTNFTKGKLPL